MVKIRLKRVGKIKQPSFRVVVADARSPRDGRNIESIGYYQPRREPSAVVIDNERALYWLQRGAQPSDSVRKLLRISGAWAAFTGEAPAEQRPAARPARRATPAASVGDPREPSEIPVATAQSPPAATEVEGER
jgi:small subunit ribosomal protein S16